MQAAMSVYLDYNATTPLAPEVLHVTTTALRDAWANPSSSHTAGRKANACIEKARCQVARMINCSSEDIVFTSGGTESNNMIIDSILRYWQDPATHGGVASEGKPHIITSILDHESVTKCVQRIKMECRADVSVIPADPTSGAVRVNDVISAITSSTILISVIFAQNETGVLQPVSDIIKAVREYEIDTARENRIFIHSDTAQAVGKVNVDVKMLGIDYITIVGHKFYGPRIGAVYVRGLGKYIMNGRGHYNNVEESVPIYSLLCGGGQERSLRPGTQNTGIIVGLGMACELVTDNLHDYQKHMRIVRDYLEDRLMAIFGDKVCFNGRYHGNERLPNTCNFSLTGKLYTGQRIVGGLECSQVGVGAACHSKDPRPSVILLASGVPESVAVNALRVSVGRDTSCNDIDIFLTDIKRVIDNINQS